MIRVLSPTLLVLAAPGWLAACGSSAAPEPKPAVTAVPAPELRAAGDPADPHATCVAMFEQQRACGDVFVPALVEARVRHDVPPGIAERDRAEGREALLTVAHQEFQIDSTDEAIATTCQRIVEGDPDRAAGLAGRAEACLEQTDCANFSGCAIEIVVAAWDR